MAQQQSEHLQAHVNVPALGSAVITDKILPPRVCLFPYLVLHQLQPELGSAGPWHLGGCFAHGQLALRV